MPSLKADKESLGKDTAYVCGCGHSKNRPWCDGTHRSLTPVGTSTLPEEKPAAAPAPAAAPEPAAAKPTTATTTATATTTEAATPFNQNAARLTVGE